MRRYRKLPVSVLLVTAAIGGLLGGVYSIGVISASGFTVQIDSVTRVYDPFSSSPFIQYTVGLQVWSRAAIETRLARTVFMLHINGVQVDKVESSFGVYRPYGSVKYFLQFTNRDTQVASELAALTTELITVILETEVSAGFYSSVASSSSSKSFDLPDVSTSGVVGKVTIGPLPWALAACSLPINGTFVPRALPIPDVVFVLQPETGRSTSVLFDTYYASFCSNYGTFHARLRPGHYSILTEPCFGFCPLGPPLAGPPVAEVMVEPNKITSVEIAIDTGIR